jgi:hypothetical protein
MHQSCGPLQNSHFPLETSGAPLPYLNQGNPLIGCGLPNGMDNSQSSMHPLDPAFCRPMSSQQHPFLNGVSDAASKVKKKKNPQPTSLALPAFIRTTHMHAVTLGMQCIHTYI